MSLIDFIRSLICKPALEPISHPFDILTHRSGSHIRDVLHSAYPAAHIRIADRDYSAPSIGEFRDWLEIDDGDIKKYQAEYYDCDDFSAALRCAMFKVSHDYKTTISMAYAEGHTTSCYHAFNILVDAVDDIYILEPQTDGLIIYTESSYQPDFIQI